MYTIIIEQSVHTEKKSNFTQNNSYCTPKTEGKQVPMINISFSETPTWTQ